METGSRKPGCPQGHAPSETPGRALPGFGLASGDGHRSTALSVACRCVTPVSASVVTWCCPCVSVRVSSCKDTSHWGPPSSSVCPPLNPITSAKALFPNKVPLALTSARDHKGYIMLAQGQVSVEWASLASSSGHPHSTLGSGLSDHSDRCLHWDVRNWGLAELV